MNNYTYPNTGGNAMGSLLGFTEGDWKKNLSARVYDVKVHDPAKFKKAWDKNVKAAEKILGDRRIGLVSYEVGGTPGATHGLVIYGKNLNDVQKDEFKKIFRKYFLKSFSTRLVEYKEAKIVVISEDVKNEKYTIVKSKLLATSNRPEVAIDWRVYTKDPSKPLIRDLIIEGLSLARTRREEFNSIIINNGGDINALFTSLKEFNKK